MPIFWVHLCEWNYFLVSFYYSLKNAVEKAYSEGLLIHMTFGTVALTSLIYQAIKVLEYEHKIFGHSLKELSEAK